MLNWLDYFWGVLLKAHTEFEERVLAVESLPKKQKNELIREAINEMQDVFSLKDMVEKLPGVSREMIKIVVNEFKENGVLISEGKGRGAKLRKIKQSSGRE